MYSTAKMPFLVFYDNNYSRRLGAQLVAAFIDEKTALRFVESCKRRIEQSGERFGQNYGVFKREGKKLRPVENYFFSGLKEKDLEKD